MSLFKGKLDSGNKFTVSDYVTGLEILKGEDGSGNALPAYLQLEAADGLDNFMWWDDSVNLRVSSSAPTNATKNSGGSVVTGVSNAGANRTLSNLGTVDFNTDFLPDTTATYDLGSTTLYMAEIYAAKYLGHANATLTGATTGWTIAGKTTWGSDGGGGNADLVWYAHTATNFVTFDEDQECVTFEDETFLKFGTGRDISIDWDGTDLNIDPAADDSVIRFGESHDLDVVMESFAIAGQDMGWIADLGTFQLCDDTIFHIGGTTVLTADDGFTFVFDGTATLSIDAVTAQDSISIGENVVTDFELFGNAYDVIWDASEDELIFGDNVEVIFGAGKDLQIESTGTVTNFTMAATTGGIVIQPHAAATVAAVHIDGATNDWDGADNVGMLHISSDTALIHAGASLLNVTQATAKPINSAQGFLARFIDTSPVASATPAYAVEIDSTNNFGLHIVTGRATSTNLVLDGLAAQTVAIQEIDGSTGTGWDGADDVGMLQLTSDSILVANGATMLRVASSAQQKDGAEGALARFENTGAARADAVMVEIVAKDSTEIGLNVGAGQIQATAHRYHVTDRKATDTGATTGTIAQGTDFIQCDTTTADNLDIVLLPTAVAGTVMYILNDSAARDFELTAAASDKINGGAAAGASTVGEGVLVRLVAVTDELWIATQFATDGTESKLDASA